MGMRTVLKPRSLTLLKSANDTQLSQCLVRMSFAFGAFSHSVHSSTTEPSVKAWKIDGVIHLDDRYPVSFLIARAYGCNVRFEHQPSSNIHATDRVMGEVEAIGTCKERHPMDPNQL